MRDTWERDVQFNQRRIRDNSWSPWSEARKWRRRFYVALMVDVALIAALALGINALGK